jgi:hypothetical protein
LKDALRSSGKVAALASEEEDEALWLGAGPYVAVFDPLDGSRNIDASIPTGKSNSPGFLHAVELRLLLDSEALVKYLLELKL